jgi:radical SAM superfamily enzyme YgiQ (UPF0313 family)
MRILVIIPTIGYRRQYPSFVSMTNFPIGPGYVASSLRAAGHEVFGLNANNRPNFDSAHHMMETLLLRALHEYEPEMVAIGGLCLDFPFIRDAIEVIRNQSPHVPIVLGGGIVTNDTEFVLNALHPDISVYGEAEETTVKVANMIASGEQDFESIPNIGFWKNGEAVFTKKSFDYCPIDELPFPEYDIFDMDEMLDGFGFAANYFWRASHAYPRPMSITTARSCPYACTFCVHRGANPPYRARSTQNIMDELHQLHERYEFNTLIIVDELFAAKRSKLTEFCEGLIEGRDKYGWDFGWWFQTHANIGITKKDLELAKEAGLAGWTYGLESASPTVLKSMDKRSKPHQIVNAIKLSEEVKVTYGGLFIFGDPAETPETIKESMDFFKEHCVGHNIHKLYVKPYPGSPLYNYCLEKGLIEDPLQYYETMDDKIFNMTSMPDELYFSWIEELLSYESRAGFGKYSVAHRISPDPESMSNPVSLHYNVPIWKVWADCPWCGEEDFCREMIVEPEAPSPRLLQGGRAIKRKALGLARELKHRPRSQSKRQVILEAIKRKSRQTKDRIGQTKGEKHLLFDTLEPFSEDFSVQRCSSTFPTNCQHCGRRYYVGVDWRLKEKESVNEPRSVLLRPAKVSSQDEISITTGLGL